MLPIHTILHPTDFSEFAEGAFQLACSLARDLGARIIVLYVDPPPVCHGELVARRQPNGYHQELWQKLHQIQAPDSNVFVEHRLEEGEAGPEILRLATAENCGLIVMGTHGRTGLRRLLMGSVAEQVVRHAPCPVLTVKSPWPKTEAVAHTRAEATAGSSCATVAHKRDRS